jgi:sporulation protein YlmC with PRC-barrel domain
MPLYNFIGRLVLAALVTLCGQASAQDAGKVETEVAERLVRLVGAVVLAADGPQIGKVADVWIDTERRRHRIRVDVDRYLGLGSGAIEIPWGAFRIEGRHVILGLDAEAVRLLPIITGHDADK